MRKKLKKWQKKNQDSLELSQILINSMKSIKNKYKLSLQKKKREIVYIHMPILI